MLVNPIIKQIWLVMRLCQPPDGNTSPKYTLLCFITTKKICKEKNALAFNRDRCCFLVLSLQLIPSHLASSEPIKHETMLLDYIKVSIQGKYFSLFKVEPLKARCHVVWLCITSLLLKHKLFFVVLKKRISSC